MSTGRQPTQFQKVIEHDRGTKWDDMTRKQKVIFVSKVVVCVCTLGFAFPNVQND
ncbi:MAG TPA: hypothetical protein VEU32_11060 [Burkholderiales bacterium]|nr:hypothetical protein [Burkholderiales bacterium]